MSKYKFTIITVCYNAEKFIAETIKSVLSQTYADYQYIIKDGMSCDKTMEIVHGLTADDNRVMMIQDNDKGIYDAMNIAVSQAEGEYVIFLNAGDTFCDADVLNGVASGINEQVADVYYGNMVQIEILSSSKKYSERIYGQNSVNKLQYAIGRCICHQTMFAKRKLFMEKLFDINLRVCADREWQMYFLGKGYAFQYLPITVSKVLTDGYSKGHENDLEKEARICVSKYCKYYLWIYDGIMCLKRNVVLRKILQKIDALSVIKELENDE